jgi:hypothetical protein
MMTLSDHLWTALGMLLRLGEEGCVLGLQKRGVGLLLGVAGVGRWLRLLLGRRGQLRQWMKLLIQLMLLMLRMRV